MPEPSKAQPTVTQPSKDAQDNTATNSKKHLSDNKLFWVVISALLIVLIASVALILSKKEDNTKQTDNPYQYSYKAVVATKFEGAGPGKGASYKVPKPLSATAIEDRQHAEYSQHLSKDNKNKVVVLVARQTIYTEETTNKGPADFYGKVTGDMLKKKDKNDPYYKNLSERLDYYLKKSFYSSKDINITRNDAVAFKSANITKNAWQFDIKVTDKTSKMPAQTGKLIYAIGSDNTPYFYILSAEDNNWQNNKAFFDSIIESIKLNE